MKNKYVKCKHCGKRNNMPIDFYKDWIKENIDTYCKFCGQGLKLDVRH